MAEENKDAAYEDKESAVLGLELVTAALDDYFSLRQEGKKDEDILREGAIDIEKKPLSLSRLIGDFTYSFLGSKDIKLWTSKDSVTKMPDERKYLLKLVGRRVKSNGTEIPEEQRGFDFVVSYLKYLNKTRSEDAAERSKAYAKLHDFFSRIYQITGEETEQKDSAI